MKRLVFGAISLSLMFAFSGCSSSEYDGSFECKDKETGWIIKLKVEDNKITMGMDNLMSPAMPYTEGIIDEEKYKVAKFTVEDEKYVFGKFKGEWMIVRIEGKRWRARCVKK